MRRGFTLVELLAVIILLAIISLIVVPIVLNYVDDAKSISNKESFQLYIEQVEKKIMERRLQKNVVVSGTYDIMSDGNICLKWTSDVCDDILKLELEKSHPTSGTITILDEFVTGYSFTIDGDTFTSGG